MLSLLQAAVGEGGRSLESSRLQDTPSSSGLGAGNHLDQQIRRNGRNRVELRPISPSPSLREIPNGIPDGKELTGQLFVLGRDGRAS